MAGGRYRVRRERDVSGPTELRIHGVGAAPPERLLRTDHPVFVAGDAAAGFYRLRPQEEGTPAVEAYSWGGLTARRAGLQGLKKALWVFLLPFALLNTARWMVPEGETRYELVMRRLRRGLVQVLGYLATVGGFAVLFALTVEGVGLNCVMRSDAFPEAACAQKLWLGWFRDNVSWFVDYPARMVVLSLVPAILVMLALRALTQRGDRSFAQRFGVPPEDSVLPDGTDAGELPLIGRRDLWTDVDRARRLRSLHFAGVMAFLAFLVGVGVFDVRTSLASDIDTVLGPVAIAVFVAAGLGCTVSTLRWTLLGKDWSAWVWWLGCAVLAVAVVSTVGGAERIDADFLEEESLAFERFFEVLPAQEEIDRRAADGSVVLEAEAGRRLGWFIDALEVNYDAVNHRTWWGVLTPAVAVLGLLGLLFAVPPRSRDRVLGFGPPLVALFGLLLQFLGLISLSMWLTVYLDVALLPIYTMVRMAFLIVLVVALLAAALLGVVALLHAARGRKKRLPALSEKYWDAVGEPPPEARQADLDWLKGRDRDHRMRWVTKAFMVPVGAMALAGSVLVLYSLQGPADARPVERFLVDDLRWAENLSIFVTLTYLPILVLVVWQFDRIGYLWDVLTFWPRWGHPFAPPSYPLRTVPEIAARVSHRLTGKVVVSGHSQGSVLAAAAVAGLSPANRKRVGLLTHGSPLAGLYGTFFPDYFGTAQLEKLARSLEDPGGPPRWRNVYRESDPIGGPVFAAPPGGIEFTVPPREPHSSVDIEAPDPFPGPVPLAGDPMPAMKGHSDYDEDQPYDVALWELWELLEVERAQTATGKTAT